MTKGTGRFCVFFQFNSTQPVLQMVYGIFLLGQIKLFMCGYLMIGEP